MNHPTQTVLVTHTDSELFAATFNGDPITGTAHKHLADHNTPTTWFVTNTNTSGLDVTYVGYTRNLNLDTPLQDPQFEQVRTITANQIFTIPQPLAGLVGRQATTAEIIRIINLIDESVAPGHAWGKLARSDMFQPVGKKQGGGMGRPKQVWRIQ